MDKKIKNILIAGTIIIILVFLNSMGAFGFLNKYISGKPDTSCKIDSDCVLKKTTCNYCDCGSPVNKNWNVFCPFRKSNAQVLCELCPHPSMFDIKCIVGQCEMILNTSETLSK